jgi:hypothetical protein
MLFQVHVDYFRDVIVFAELEEWYNCCVCTTEAQREDAVCGMAW